MEIGSGLQVWKVEAAFSPRLWGVGIAVGDPEELREDVGLLVWLGPFQLFIGRGLTWRTGG